MIRSLENRLCGSQVDRNASGLYSVVDNNISDKLLGSTNRGFPGYAIASEGFA
jgi:hypothetical protein